ncbi:MAG: type II toxin-antitoxin system VapC family toxin [Thermoguttaceae bacterium]
MRFLLDTDVCSAHIRRPSGLAHRFMQHSGRMCISAPTLAELYAWANLLERPEKILAAVEQLKEDLEVLPFDDRCAKEFGRLRGVLRHKGVVVSPIDLMIASVALAHDLTLVTHNTADFRSIPDLRLDDWLG